MSHAVLSKVRALRSSTLEVLVELDEVLDAVLLALVGGKNIFLLGEPGIAKSFLVDQLVARISGVRYFKDQFHRTYTIDDAFGPLDVPAFKAGRKERAITGFSPASDLCFWDEGFKATGSLLNATLMFTNERKFRQNGELIDVPCTSVIIASNELPGEDREELAAMYDRLTIRMVVKEVTSAAGFRQLLRLQVPEHPLPAITWTEMLEAQRQAAMIPVSDEAIDALFDMRRGVAAAGIRVSPRKWRQAKQLFGAAAWLAGDDEARPEHGDFLQHVLWDRPEEIPGIAKVVLGVVDPGRIEANEVRDQVQGIAEEAEKALASDDLGAMNLLFGRVGEVKRDVAKKRKGAKGKTALAYDATSTTLDNLARRLAAGYGLGSDDLSAELEEAG